MKKLTGLVGVIAVLVLGSYYGMGFVTERTLKRNINVMNQSNGFLVEVDEYHRGWFTSNALLHWRLQVPERVVKNKDGTSTTVPAQEYNVDMPLIIYHGPIIVANAGVHFGLGFAHTDLQFPPSYAKQFSDLFTDASTQPKLRLNVFVSYLNNCRFHTYVPKFKLITKQDNTQFNWGGMTSDLSVSSNLNHVDGRITIDGMELQKNKMQATVGTVNSDYDLKSTEAGLFLGDANLSLPSVVIAENHSNIFEALQFDVHSRSGVDNALFHSELNTSLNKMVIRGKTYGPARLVIAIKNLDAAVLAEINKESSKIQQGTDAQRQQALFSLLPQLPKLFSKGAQFEISELSLGMPEGAVNGNLLVTLPAEDIGNPFQLLQKLQGDAKLVVPVAVLKRLVLLSVEQKMRSKPLEQTAVQQPPSEPTTTLPPTDAQKAVTKQDANAVSQVAPSQGAQNPPQQTTASPTTASSTTASSTTASSTTASPATAVLSEADFAKQATEQSEQKLQALVQAGLLSIQGANYVVVLNLKAGQLTVNGQPFNPKMMAF